MDLSAEIMDLSAEIMDLSAKVNRVNSSLSIDNKGDTEKPKKTKSY